MIGEFRLVWNSTSQHNDAVEKEHTEEMIQKNQKKKSKEKLKEYKTVEHRL